MKKFLLIAAGALLLGMTTASAQYKVETEKMDANKKFSPTKPNRSTACLPEDDGKTITYTPQYFATNPGMYKPGAYISFQKIENEKYIYMHYAIFNASELDEAVIKEMNFVFRDGTKLDLPCAYNFIAITYPQGKQSAHAMRAKITEEQIDLFTKKQLMSVGITFANGKSFNAESSDKRSNGVAMRAIYFQTGEKVKEKELKKIFEANKSEAIQDDANWDF